MRSLRWFEPSWPSSRFVTKHASRIEHIGLSPVDVTALAAAMLDDWQGSSRLDLPGFDEHWLRLPED